MTGKTSLCEITSKEDFEGDKPHRNDHFYRDGAKKDDNPPWQDETRKESSEGHFQERGEMYDVYEVPKGHEMKGKKMKKQRKKNRVKAVKMRGKRILCKLNV